MFHTCGCECSEQQKYEHVWIVLRDLIVRFIHYCYEVTFAGLCLKKAPANLLRLYHSS